MLTRAWLLIPIEHRFRVSLLVAHLHARFEQPGAAKLEKYKVLDACKVACRCTAHLLRSPEVKKIAVDVRVAAVRRTKRAAHPATTPFRAEFQADCPIVGLRQTSCSAGGLRASSEAVEILVGLRPNLVWRRPLLLCTRRLRNGRLLRLLSGCRFSGRSWFIRATPDGRLLVFLEKEVALAEQRDDEAHGTAECKEDEAAAKRTPHTVP